MAEVGSRTRFVTRDVVCCASLESRGALPGGYKVGDAVCYIGQSFHYTDGDKKEHSTVGKVTGRCGPGPLFGKGVQVLFSYNHSSIDCRVDEVRLPCPLRNAGLLPSRCPQPCGA